MADNERDRLLRLPEVRRETGFGTTTIYRLMANGKWPVPAFSEDQLEAGKLVGKRD